MTVSIRAAQPDDNAAILALGRELVNEGTTYVFGPKTSDADLLTYWLDFKGWTFVAQLDDRVVGCALLKPNQPGRGAHVANAAFVVASEARGHGVGRALAEHVLAEARDRGFRAMQFNLVVATNMGAVRLWEDLGFEIVGTLPQVFDHPQQGLVDAYVMHRLL